MGASHLHPVEARLAELWPPEDWHPKGVVIALSGGPDSVALFRAMVALCPEKFPFIKGLIAAHFNHQLRGAASEEDAQWVLGLCQRWGVPCQVGTPSLGEELKTRKGRPSEALARKARYQFLRQVAEEHGLRYVATAHTADDQIETILHRILRGTGIAGLAGMNRARPLGPAVSLIRPLLPFRREELRQYLADLGQEYRHDASNEDLRFTRNRIRHRLLPLLREQFGPHVEGAILRLGRLAGEVSTWIQSEASRFLEEVAFPEGPTWIFRADRLAKLPSFLIREIFRSFWRQQGWPQQHMGQAEWEVLVQAVHLAMGFTSTRVARWTLPGAILVEAAKGQVRLSPS
ncbi:MAG: tRNA lysidine(34) synthetase TilS [Thermoguttaceae bacterium]|nr:tRNA lysidine(34) synthetase TilS [Thermoguttaceae bacterium]MDW8039436.1 tRNA lysidine(34) synthetase TilS [Thermoguttaceae bacterium]